MPFLAQEPPKKKKRERVELSDEKSREGLGDIYEKAYLEDAMGIKGSDEGEEKKRELSKMFASICSKLDALSNFYFTPKPRVDETDVKVDVPAISMEEIIPTAVGSESRTAAPEEIVKPKIKAAELKEETDKTREDRHSEHLQKKKAKRLREKMKERERKQVEKLNPGLGNKYARAKVMEEIASRRSNNVTVVDTSNVPTEKYTKSNAFFRRLQDTVAQEVKSAKTKGTGDEEKKKGKGKKGVGQSGAMKL